jgi:hypothetical protein
MRCSHQPYLPEANAISVAPSIIMLEPTKTPISQNPETGQEFQIEIPEMMATRACETSQL